MRYLLQQVDRELETTLQTNLQCLRRIFLGVLLFKEPSHKVEEASPLNFLIRNSKLTSFLDSLYLST
jgi:hypothetical protein